MMLEDSLRRPGTVLLDHSRRTRGDGRHRLFTNPIEILRADRVADVETVLNRLTRHVGEGRHAAGFMAYEAASAWIDIGEEAAEDTPLVWFGIYESPITPDADELERLFSNARSRGPKTGRPNLTISDADYLRAVEDVRRLIREGDVYQVNYTGRFDSAFEGDPLELFGRLRARQPVEYGAFIDCGDMHVLSLSPELFFRRTGRAIETRPMKGTAPRGRTPEEDDALIAWLRSDPKSLAENLMIVDLLRNDLSVVCETGSVRVPDLYVVETYPTLHQMISRVTGQLERDIGPAELFRALFPCGSVTGAPKRRAMRRIRELESGPRGVYCGAVGFISPEESVFSVAIRTAVVRGGRLRLGSGSGIVWDSDPREELAEARLKTSFFGDAAPSAGSGIGPGAEGFSLIETMLVDDGRVPLMDAHLRRLASSAGAFGWTLDITSVRDVLERSLTDMPAGRHRLRILVGPAGAEGIETAPIGESVTAAPGSRGTESGTAGSEAGPLRIAVARTGVHSANPFLRHKTTRRDVYDRARKEAEERGLDEVILVNERGEITEGAVTNVFLRMDSGWCTPAPASGLLQGVARSVFMDAVGAVERFLTPVDLRNASEIVLTNAVRGVRRAVLDE